jgi:plastocyanin
MRGALVLLALLLAGCSGAPRFDVGMSNPRFVPQELTVHAGATVVWYNNSSLAHTVTSDDAAGPLRSAQILPDASFRWSFDQPGRYSYHCEPHAYRNATTQAYEGMVGTVVVV